MLDALLGHNRFRGGGLDVAPGAPLTRGIEIPAPQRDLIPRSWFSHCVRAAAQHDPKDS